jgi:hypothetical protein
MMLTFRKGARRMAANLCGKVIADTCGKENLMDYYDKGVSR